MKLILPFIKMIKFSYNDEKMLQNMPSYQMISVLAQYNEL